MGIRIGLMQAEELQQRWHFLGLNQSPSFFYSKYKVFPVLECLYVLVCASIYNEFSWALLESALFTQIVISLEAQIQLCSYMHGPLLLKHKHPCEHVDHYHYAYPLNPSGCIILCIKISHQSHHELQSDIFYRTLHALYLQIYSLLYTVSSVYFIYTEICFCLLGIGPQDTDEHSSIMA